MLALDRGAGIEDVSAAMTDGYSTAGTPGNGLGAISRLSETFQLYTLPGRRNGVSRGCCERRKMRKAVASKMSAISAPVTGEPFAAMRGARSTTGPEYLHRS